MNFYPTGATFQVAVAGALLVAVAALTRIPAVLGFGCVILLAVATGRAFGLVSVVRLRRAGFEMVWRETERTASIPLGETARLTLELRNRSKDDVLVTALRPLASSLLDISLSENSLVMAPGETRALHLAVKGRRVGRFGVHGLAVEVRGMAFGGEGLYEVPLLFANPFGVEIQPRGLVSLALSPRGGRSFRTKDTGHPSPRRGEGDELRELREHQAGDPFRRIAWKASARRGVLMVREMNDHERDVVWVLFDASSELWAGQPGEAPADLLVESVASCLTRHLARGDDTALVVYASRLRTWIAPERGRGAIKKMTSALCSASSLVDADRTELDEVDVAGRVAEHARPLDPFGLSDLPRGDLDALSERAETLRARAPFSPRKPFAPTPREETLRHYLSSFGIDIPTRKQGERERSERTLEQIATRLVSEKVTPSIVHVFAPAPSGRAPLRALSHLVARRGEVRWTLPMTAGVVREASIRTQPQAAHFAVLLRNHVAEARAIAEFRRARIRLVLGQKGHHP